MSDSEQETPLGAAPPGSAAPDLAAYARDLITLWQSELAAMATDREMQEGFQRHLELWSNWARDCASHMRGMPPHDPHGRAAPAAPPGAPAAAAASAAWNDSAWNESARNAGDRDAELARLAARVAELERKLAELSERS